MGEESDSELACSEKHVFDWIVKSLGRLKGKTFCDDTKEHVLPYILSMNLDIVILSKSERLRV